MRFLLRGLCCHSLSIDDQVAPFKYTDNSLGGTDGYDELSDSEVSSHSRRVRKVDVIKLKPQSSSGHLIYANQVPPKIALEDELFMFVSSLTFVLSEENYLNVESYSLSFPLCNYMYHPQPMNSKSSRTAVVSQLVYALKSVLMKNVTASQSLQEEADLYPSPDLLAPFTSPSIQFIYTLSLACRSWTQLLKEYIQNNASYCSSSSSSHFSSLLGGAALSHNGFGFQTLEQAFMVSDVLLLGLVQNVTNLYNLTFSTSSDDPTSRDAAEAAQQLLESFSRETIEVLRMVLAVASSIEEDSSCFMVVTPHCKVLYSQIVCKVAWLLLQFGKVLSKLDPTTKSHFILTMLPSMVSITQIGSSALQLMTNIVGDSSMGYYYSRLLYWHACIHLLQLLQCIAFNQLSASAVPSSSNSSSSSSNSNVDPNLVAATASSSSSHQQLQQQVYIWSLQKRVFSYLQSTTPSTHDIFYEVHRSEDYTQTLFSSQEDDGGLMQLLATMEVSSRSMMTGDRMLHAHGAGGSGGTAPDVISFKLRFLLIGMSSVFRGHSILLNRSNCNYRNPVPTDALSVPFPAKEKWVLSLTEIMLNILSRVRQSCSDPSNSSSSGSGSSNNNIGPSPTALHLLMLCPYLAQHLLALTAQTGTSNSNSKDPTHGQASSRLIFIDLAKSLSDFTLLLRRRRELVEQMLVEEQMMMMMQAVEACQLLSVKDSEPVSIKEGSRSTMKAGRNKAARRRRSMPRRGRRDASAAAAVAIASERKDDVDATPMSSFTNKPANIAPPSFAVGDQVDGLCVLSNGSKRWFPGIIITADSSTDTYAVQFNDGDVDRCRDSSSLRHRKQRVKTVKGMGMQSQNKNDHGYAGDECCSMSMMSSNDEISCISSLDNFSVTGSLTGEFTEHIVDLYPNSAPPLPLCIDEAPAPASSRSLCDSSIESVQDSGHPKNSNDIDEIIIMEEEHCCYHLMPSSAAATKRSSLGRGLFNINGEDFQAFLTTTTTTATAEEEDNSGEDPQRGQPCFTDSFALSPSFVRDSNEDHTHSRDVISAGAHDKGGDDDDDDDDVVSVASSMPSTVKSGPDEIQRALSDTSSEGDRIFEIPSVFDHGIHRSNNNNAAAAVGSAALKQSREGLIPRMRFDDLDMSGALVHNSSNFSLSGALLSANRQPSNSNSFRGDATSTSRSSFRRGGGPMPQMISQRSIADMSIITDNASSSRSNANRRGGNHPITCTQQHTDISSGEADTTAGRNTHQLSWQAATAMEEQASQCHSGIITMPMPDARRRDGTSLARTAAVASNNDAASVSATMMSELDPFHRWAVSVTEGDQHMNAMFQTHAYIVAILLQQCVTKTGLLSSTACGSSTDLCSPLGISSSSSMADSQQQQPSHTNILFLLREFFEATDCRFEDVLIRFSLFLSDASMRLCKMLSRAYFSNCLPQLVEKSGEKIGEGGFGCVYKVTIPSGSPTQLIGRFDQYANCYSCYRSKNMDAVIGRHAHASLRNKQQPHSRSTALSLSRINTNSSSSSFPCRCWRRSSTGGDEAGHSFAIKRISRERSIHDNSLVIAALFNEITCLELLRGHIGICGLEDYGVYESEYWIVMEHGLEDLEEWRLNLTPNAKDSTKHPGFDTLTRHQICTCLLLFVDALLIVKAMHAADVAHFDIKSNNFILRSQHPTAAAAKTLHEMHSFHCRGMPSGVLFLADFGEAVPLIDKQMEVQHHQQHHHRSKCRGTLSIQSPEMLSINETSSSSSSMGKHIQSYNTPGKESDVWSLGCLLFEVLMGGSLFADQPWTELYITLCKDTYDPSSILNIAGRLAKPLQSAHTEVLLQVTRLLHSILQQKPSKRMRIPQAIAEVTSLLETFFSDCLHHHPNRAASIDDDENRQILTPIPTLHGRGKLYPSSRSSSVAVSDAVVLFGTSRPVQEMMVDLLSFEDCCFIEPMVLPCSNGVFLVLESESGVMSLIDQVTRPFELRAQLDDYQQQVDICLQQLVDVDREVHATMLSGAVRSAAVQLMQRVFQERRSIFIINVKLLQTASSSSSPSSSSSSTSLNHHAQKSTKWHRDDSSCIRTIDIHVHDPTMREEDTARDISYLLHQIRCIVHESILSHVHTRGNSSTGGGGGGGPSKRLQCPSDIYEDVSPIVAPLVIVTVDELPADWSQQLKSTQHRSSSSSSLEEQSALGLLQSSHMDRSGAATTTTTRHHLSKVQFTVALSLCAIMGANILDMKIHPLTISGYMHLINPHPSKTMMSNYSNNAGGYSTSTPTSSARSGTTTQKEIPMECLEACLGRVVQLTRSVPAAQQLCALDLLNALVMHVNKK